MIGLRCGFLLWGLLARPVHAGEVERAEAVRLSEELRREVGDGAWAAADADYARLVELPGVSLRFEDHWRGFLAAQAMGDANAQHQRLLAARALNPSAEVLAAQARLLAWVGPVDLRLHPRVDPRPHLVMDEVPMDGDLRRVLEAADQALRAEGRYQGLLPLGQYQLGERRFEVIGDTEPVVVEIRR